MSRYYRHTFRNPPPEIIHHYGGYAGESGLNFLTRPQATQLFGESWIGGYWKANQDAVVKAGSWSYPFGARSFPLSGMLNMIKDWDSWSDEEFADLAYMLGISSILERGKRQSNYERLMVLNWHKNLMSVENQSPERKLLFLQYAEADLSQPEGRGIPAPRTRDALNYAINRFKAAHGLQIRAPTTQRDTTTGISTGPSAEEIQKQEEGRLAVEKKRAERMAEELAKYKYGEAEKERNLWLIGGGILVSSLIVAGIVRGARK